MAGDKKVTVPRKALANALERVNRVIPNCSSKPILMCVRIEAADGLLSVAGTDLESCLKVNLNAEGDLPETLVNVADLIRRVKTGKTPDCVMWIEERPEAPADPMFCMNGGKTTHRLPTMPLKDYPPIPTKPNGIRLAIAQPLLRQRLSIVLTAVAKENTRYAINGVFIEATKGQITIVATDGRREVACKLGKTDADVQADAIVSEKTCLLLTKLLNEKDRTDIRTHIEYRAPEPTDADRQANRTPEPIPHMVHFIGPDFFLSSTVVEGHFPDWRCVIPRDGSRFMMNRQELIELTKEVSLATGECNKGVKLRLSDEGLDMTARDGAGQESEGRISCTFVGGSDRVIWTGFNPDFLLDAINTLRDEFIYIDVQQNRPSHGGGSAVQHLAARFFDASQDIHWVVMPVQTCVPANEETLGSNFPKPEPTMVPHSVVEESEPEKKSRRGSKKLPVPV